MLTTVLMELKKRLLCETVLEDWTESVCFLEDYVVKESLIWNLALRTLVKSLGIGF